MMQFENQKEVKKTQMRVQKKAKIDKLNISNRKVKKRPFGKV